MEGPPNNPLRQFFVEAIDAFWREPRLILRHFRPFSFGKMSSNCMMYVADGKLLLGGMFDRLKGIVTLYAIAKAQGRNFKIHFTHPFELSDYLVPNTYNWQLGKDESIIYSFPQSRPIFAFGEYSNPRRLFKKRKGQVHYYYGYNSLDQVNERFGTNYEWSELYKELFKPSDYLQKYLDHYQKEVGEEYIVAHTRFLNLLGDKVELACNPELPQDQANKLCQRCVDEVRKLQQQTALRIMIASDSMRFINEVKRQIPEVYIVPGTVAHIGVAQKTDDEQVLKMFIDYHLIAGSKKVYSIVGKGMWQSAFPEFAAKIGNVHFERIMV